MAKESPDLKVPPIDAKDEAFTARLRRRYLTKGGTGVNTPVTQTATTQAVTFVSTEPDATFGVTVTPNWDTRWWVTNKATTGFTANFSAAAPANATIDWTVFRS